MDVNDYGLVALVNGVLLEFVLELLEGMEFLHPSGEFDGVFPPH